MTDDKTCPACGREYLVCPQETDAATIQVQPHDACEHDGKLYVHEWLPEGAALDVTFSRGG